MYDGTSLTSCLEELGKAAKIADGLSELWEFDNSREEDDILKAILCLCNRVDHITESVRRNAQFYIDN